MPLSGPSGCREAFLFNAIPTPRSPNNRRAKPHVYDRKQQKPQTHEEWQRTKEREAEGSQPERAAEALTFNGVGWFRKQYFGHLKLRNRSKLPSMQCR